jgi:arsenical pump membrane protein
MRSHAVIADPVTHRRIRRSLTNTSQMNSLAATWIIAAVATGGVILRPWRLPEAIWAVTGAALLVLAGLLSAADAWRGVLRGTDVYLFLIGMMLLAEVARVEGLFNWLAAHAANHANGSANRLFALVYLVGALVTIFMSNDATAVVLTPAVAAVVRAARVEYPMPYLFICAFIANAASFVLPISNPANLVIYGTRMPPLLMWLPHYLLPSALAIAATYIVLRILQRDALRRPILGSVTTPRLSAGGHIAAVGIALTALTLMTASAMGWRLGPPTCACGIATMLAVVPLRSRRSWHIARDISWGIIPLVAGLFVLVEALDRTGVIGLLAGAVTTVTRRSPVEAVFVVGFGLALLCNVMNNLPAGLIAGTAAQSVGTHAAITGAVLVGVDLGPNLSVTGSLATILWLAQLRREGVHVTGWAFLRLGLIVMPVSALLALAGLWATEQWLPEP